MRRGLVGGVFVALSGCGEVSFAPERFDGWPYGDVHASSAFTFSAVGEVLETAPPEVNVRVTASNTSAATSEIQFGGCAFSVRVYRDPERRGRPSWHNVPAGGAACYDVLLIEHVAPGEQFTWDLGQFSPAILGDSLPTGTYYFSAAFHLNGSLRELFAGQVTWPSATQ
jgi:hypothetical protein